MRVERPIIAAILFAGWLFFIVAVLQITQFHPMPFPFVNIDEQAHYAYTADLIRNHAWWVDFNHFFMVDVKTGLPTSEPNYVNHPPQFYWLMKLVQQTFPTADPVHYRIVPLVFYLAAMAVYARIGYLLRLPTVATAVYVLLPMILYMPLQSGYYNNDGVAICGGMLACLGSFHWFSGKAKRGFLWLVLGVTLASVKLTALLLVGLYALFTLLLHRAPLKQLPWTWLVIAALWGFILALPFAYFWLHYGSPAPHSPGQDYLMTHNAKAWGWAPEPRHGFLGFLPIALSRFSDQFGFYEFTFVPLLWLIAAYGYFMVKPGKLASVPMRMMAASLIATLIVLGIHMGFAYPRYLKYGWLLDSFVRYYFPLLPTYGVAAAYFYLWMGDGRKDHAARA